MPKRKRLVCVLVVLSILIGSAPGSLAAPALQIEPEIVPRSITLTIPPGQGFSQTLTVTTGETPVPKLDVLFLFDVTGSMGGVIDAAKANGVDIMETVRDRVPDSAFGVASFGDYPTVSGYGDPGDYPWRLDQAITKDFSLVQAAIGGLSAYGGGDGPESYSRALFEAALLDWRIGAKRVIVLFGDAPAHDPDFYGVDYGIDPGPDEEIGTADDIRFSEIVGALAEGPIVILPINSGENEGALRGFQYMATETGGRVFSIENADEAPAAVIQGLDETVGMINRLTAYLSADAPPWATVVADEFTEIGGGETVVFGIEFDVSPWVEPGVYEFGITIDADGAILGTVPVSVEVSGGAEPLNVAELLEEKQQLIDFHVRPSWTFNYGWADIRRHFDSGNYKDSEKKVEEFVSSIAADGDAAPPAAVASLSRLAAQEDAMKRLWTVNAESTDIIGRQTGNVVVVLVSALNFFDFLKRPDIRSGPGMGGFVTKCLNKAYAKITDALGWFVDLLLALLPDSPAARVIRASVRTMKIKVMQKFEAGAGIEELIAEGVVSWIVIEEGNSTYIENTDPFIIAGLNAAKAHARGDMTPQEASADVEGVRSQVGALVSPAEDTCENIKGEARKIEVAQDLAKVVADAADIATVLSTVGVVSACVAPVAKAVGIAIRVLDAVGSGYLLYRSFVLWHSLDDTAREATLVSFPSAAVGYSAPDTYAVLYDVTSLDLSGLHEARPKPLFATTLTARVTDSADDYRAILEQVRVAAARGDASQVADLTETIFGADDRLVADLRTSQAPAVAVASDATLASDSEWQEAYGDILSGSSHFDLYGSIFYFYLGGYLAEPENTEMQAGLLASIDDLDEAVRESVTAVAEILPLTEGHLSQPVVTVSEVRYPEDITVGEVFEISVTLENPIPRGATGVSASFLAESGIELVSPVEVSIGEMGGEGVASVSYAVRLTDPNGLATIETGAISGIGQLRSVIISATEDDTAVPPPPGGGGLGIALVLLVAAIGGVFVYVSHQRRNRPPGVQPASRASLGVLAGPNIGQQLAVLKDQFLIGRGSSCDLHVSDPAASRRHAVIRYAQGRWFLQDQGSMHGTFVNGQRVEATALSDGDRIRIGDTEFEFRLG